jgi:hypothetical protein
MDYKKLAEVFWLFLEKNPSRKTQILAALRKVLTYFIDGSIELSADDAANAIFSEVFIKHMDELKTYIIDQGSQENIFDCFFEETPENYVYKSERLKCFIDCILKIEATKLFKEVAANGDAQLQEVIDFLQKRKLNIVDMITDDLNYLGIHGESALHWAAYYGNYHLACELIDNGAYVDLTDKENQRTPIMWAMLRILHDPGKYINFITLMVRNYNADTSARDHNGRNISHVISFFQGGLNQLGFLRNYVSEGELHLFNAPDHGGNASDEFYQHGDDSSDDETTDTQKYDLPAKLKAFKASDAYKQSSDDGKFRKRVCLSFVLHAKGLLFLYSNNVNNYYYKEQKRLLGSNEKPDRAKLMVWIREALYLTIQTINFSGTDIPDAQKKKVDAFLDGNDEESEGHPGVVDDFVANIHKVLRVADLRLAQESLSEYLNVFSGNPIWKKSFATIRQQHDLKGKKETTIVAEYPTEVMAQLSPETKDNQRLYKRYILRLKELLGINKKTSKKLFTSSSSSTTADLDVDEKVMSAFRLTFFYYLRDLRSKHQIVISRGLNERVIYDVSQNHADSVLWFSSMRMTNRFYKRKLKHRENKHFVGHPNAKDASKIRFGYCVTDYSFWRLPSNKMVLYKEQITTQQARTNLVEFTFSKDSTYKSISVHIAKLIAEPGNNVTDKKIAENIREILQGKPPTLKTAELNDFVSQLTYLLFFCEASRNPATFIVNQMMLDLIIEKNKTWADFFGDVGLMPMSIVNAVGCAGYLNHLFASHMPFAYQYGDNEGSSTQDLQNLLSKTDELVRMWVQNFVSNLPKIKIITKNGGKAKTEAEIKIAADSQKARQEAIDGIVNDPEKLIAEIDKRIGQWYRFPQGTATTEDDDYPAPAVGPVK